jgi:hypothetical protein
MTTDYFPARSFTAGLIVRRRGAIALSDAHQLRRLVEEAINNG